MVQKARMAMRGRRMRLLRLAALQCATITPQRSWPLGLATALTLGLAGCGGSSGDGTVANEAAAEQPGATAVAGRSEVAQAAAAPTGTETWAFCAAEGDICRVPGTRLVRYGVDGAYVYQTVTNAIGCGNAQWPDPAFRVVKHCDYASSGTTTPPAPAPAPTPAPAPAPATWTFLANEYEAFSVSGTRTVRYGLGTVWVQRNVSGSGSCTNDFFGSDPVPMKVKRCEVLPTTTAPPPPPAPAPPAPAPAPAPTPAPAPGTWSFLANENESFSLASARSVRYGIGNSWVQRTVSGNGTCSNSFFGSDPAFLQVKRCEVSGTTSAPPPAPAPAPAPAPTPAPAPPPATVGTATLGWTASSAAGVAGYRVYWGTAPRTYQQALGSGIAAGTATSFVVRDLPAGKTYYFAVTAYDGSGNESAFSAEASKSIP
jgi:pyruvate/2-oxoglutarate dehydrogenase complex dihydrolipoamide acyltransferase (E2) component